MYLVLCIKLYEHSSFVCFFINMAKRPTSPGPKTRWYAIQFFFEGMSFKCNGQGVKYLGYGSNYGPG